MNDAVAQHYGRGGLLDRILTALIKAGKDIDYTGATGSMEFDANGDVAGVIGHFVVDGAGYKEVGLVTP